MAVKKTLSKKEKKIFLDDCKVGARNVKKSLPSSAKNTSARKKVNTSRYSGLTDANYNKISGRSLKPGQREIIKVQGKNVAIERDNYLDKYGNPVYRAVIAHDGPIDKKDFYRTNGGYGNAVKGAFKKYE